MHPIIQSEYQKVQQMFLDTLEGECFIGSNSVKCLLKDMIIYLPRDTELIPGECITYNDKRFIITSVRYTPIFTAASVCMT